MSEEIKTKLTPWEIETKCRQFISDSSKHTIATDQKDRAEIYEDYFRGGKHQWTEDEYNVYKSRGVTPITINRCKPVIKGLLGMYLQSRQDISVRPRRGGSSVVAQVHKEILKHIQDISNADYVYVQVFMRGAIDTESYLKLRIDKGSNINGQPIIEGKSIWDVSVDRNATEYDLNESAAYVIEKEWKDQDEIKALYPDQEERINTAIEEINELGNSPAQKLVTYMTSESEIYNEDSEETQVPDSDMLKKYRYLIYHVYWKQTIPALVVTDLQQGLMTIETDQQKVWKLHRKGRKSKRFKITNYTVKKLHETVMLGNYLLEDIEEPLGPGVSDYPIVRFSPIWDMGYACGVLDDVTSLNKEENIHRTQIIRLLNQTANSGWFVGTDNNKEYMKLLKNFGSVPGIVIPLEKFGGRVEKITPNQLPAAHFTMASQFEQDVKRVSGIDDATLGYETGKTESGRAINLKTLSNRKSNAIVIDNFYRTLEIFGNTLLKVQMANDFYTDDEIRMIVSESSMIDHKLIAQARHRLTARLGTDLPEPRPLPPIRPEMVANMSTPDKIRLMQQVKKGIQASQEYAKAYPQLKETWEQAIRAEAIEMLLNELRSDKGLYGIKVVISPSSPTERMSQFMQLDALMKNYGQLIPPDIFIDLLDLPQKEDIKVRISQAQQAQQAQQVQQSQTSPAMQRLA